MSLTAEGGRGFGRDQEANPSVAGWQILESSQTLLHVLKRESANMNKKRQASS